MSRSRRAVAGAAALVLAVLTTAAGPSPAAAAGDGPAWRVAEDVRQDLFDAQAALLGDDRRAAERDVNRAARSARRDLGEPLARWSPSSARALRDGLADARRAAASGNAADLAAARGAVRAAVLRGSFDATLAAVEGGDVQAARSWLLLRDFRRATRFSRPGADATLAVDRLARGRTSPAAARLAVSKDLLDGYQARLRELLEAAGDAQERGFDTARAEAAAQAQGYWGILAARYRADRGAGAARSVTADFRALARAATSDDRASFAAAREAVGRDLEGFTAAPFTRDEAARRANQLDQFLGLVPIEYGRGVKDGRVTLDFEIQEAIAFRDGAEAAFADLQDKLTKRDAQRTERVDASLSTLRGFVVDAAEGRRVAAPGEVEAATQQARADLDALYPQEWKESNDESDFDIVALTLDRMEAAVSAGQYRQAEQARLEAYAFFEFGPERRLQSFDPGLVNDVEGLIWFGAAGEPGLAELIAGRAPRREVHQTRLALDDRLEDAQATLGDSSSELTVVTNAAIIVFREGLEAVLILAAITASFLGAQRRLRRPVLVGAGLGLVVSVITWVLAQTLLDSLSRYGEKLEAVVGLIAIAILLLIMNWFFHKVYWTGWISTFHKRRKKLLAQEEKGFWSAQVVGLVLLGLTSVYREGFETVLFLQSLELSAGTRVVLEGAALGLALTLAVAVATFALQRKLPYKKMLVVTGVLIGFVLVVLVGQTARTLQGTGWLSITPIDVDLPYWLGLWFGVHPTVETLLAQVAAAVFVIGSYFVAEEVRVKRPRRAARRRADAAEAPQPRTTSPV